uniref:Endonuclease/exonuclease/phosphatase domain-containing protein n=1 Tax=Glossina pallidipes TaxID=7398 RepID=A0A1B0A433_GLOPL
MMKISFIKKMKPPAPKLQGAISNALYPFDFNKCARETTTTILPSILSRNESFLEEIWLTRNQYINVRFKCEIFLGSIVRGFVVLRSHQGTVLSLAPDRDINVYNKHVSLIRDVVDSMQPPDVIIVHGDFNLCNVSWRSNAANGWLIYIGVPKKFNKSLDDICKLGLVQRNEFANINNRTLDLILSNVLDLSIPEFLPDGDGSAHDVGSRGVTLVNRVLRVHMNPVQMSDIGRIGSAASNDETNQSRLILKFHGTTSTVDVSLWPMMAMVALILLFPKRKLVSSGGASSSAGGIYLHSVITRGVFDSESNSPLPTVDYAPLSYMTYAPTQSCNLASLRDNLTSTRYETATTMLMPSSSQHNYLIMPRGQNFLKREGLYSASKKFWTRIGQTPQTLILSVLSSAANESIGASSYLMLVPQHSRVGTLCPNLLPTSMMRGSALPFANESTTSKSIVGMSTSSNIYYGIQCHGISPAV